MLHVKISGIFYAFLKLDNHLVEILNHLIYFLNSSHDEYEVTLESGTYQRMPL